MIMLPMQRFTFDNDTLERQLGVSFVNDAMLTGERKVGKLLYRFNIPKPMNKNEVFSDTIALQYAILDENGNEVSSKMLPLNDTVKVGSQLYRFSGVDFDKHVLNLSLIQTSASDVIAVGGLWPLLSTKDLMTGGPINNNRKGKYLLVEFLGQLVWPLFKRNSSFGTGKARFKSKAGHFEYSL